MLLLYRLTLLTFSLHTIERMSDSKIEFLKNKAINFRAYLESFSPDDDVKAWLTSFNETMLVPTILAVLVPMQKSGKTPDSVNELISKMKVPEDKLDEVRSKLERYITMFVEVATF